MDFIHFVVGGNMSPLTHKHVALWPGCFTRKAVGYVAHKGL